MAQATVESEDHDNALRRRLKHESNLTSGLGYGNAKKRQLNAFWNIIWPRLVAAGWTKVEGTGEKVGTMYFIPDGADTFAGRKGRDYYNRMRDVIDRVLEKRNETETEIANDYLDEFMAGDDDESGYESSAMHTMQWSQPTRRQPRRQMQSPARLDLSWKDGGSAFPRTSSRVGSEYQAVDLPLPGTFVMPKERTSHSPEEVPAPLYDQVWDPVRANAADALDHIHLDVKYTLKEPAMVALHELDYDKGKLSGALYDRRPLNGSDWTQDEKDRFRLEVFRKRKDISAVAKSIDKSVNSCTTYYLGTFKKSDDYRLLKTVCADERNDRLLLSEQHGLDACGVCGDGGELLICDACEGEFHMDCMKPPLADIPEGHWECDDCVDRNFLRARDKLLSNTYLFERMHEHSRKREAEGSSAEGSSSSDDKRFKIHAGTEESLSSGRETILRPSPKALNAAKKLAASIVLALALPKKQGCALGDQSGDTDGQRG